MPTPSDSTPFGTINLTRPLPHDLWRLGRWRDSPPPTPRGWTLEAAIVGLLILQNLLLNVVLPTWSHVIANVAMAVLLVIVGRRAGMTMDRMGLRREHLVTGLKVGAVAVAVIAAAILVGVAIPFTREFFADDRFIGVDTGDMLSEVLVRIPLVTAAFEEVAFRGVLLAVLLARFSPLAASLLSSFLFGLWHILPGLDTIASNPAGDVVEGAGAVAGILLGGVLLTGMAGLVFCWLRFRANSLVAPYLAHVANNGLAYLAGWLVVSQGWT